MIFINGKQIITHPAFQSKIVLTDDAYSEESIVYMDKADAPNPRTQVFVQILNRNFNPNISEGEDNPKWDYGFWMWVEQVLSNEFPVNVQYDENGDPILNDDGSLKLTNWENRDGIVKVCLYEHKYTLTRQVCMDNINMPYRLGIILNTYNEIQEDPFHNRADWNTIADLLKPTNHQVRLDVGVDYLDEEDNVLPSEYPPYPPVNCLWHQLKLSDCLNDLLINYDCRLLSQPSNGDPIDTYLVWKKRKPIQFLENLLYSKISWPVNTEESLATEKTSRILFPTTGSVFGSGVTGFEPYYESIGTNSGEFDLYCNLHPRINQYEDDELAYTAISEYLRETHVNMAQYFCFHTPRLPKTFYDNYEWSKIELFVEGYEAYYRVTHNPRYDVRPINYLQSQSFNVYFRGMVLGVESNAVTLTSILDVTNNKIIDGTRRLESVDVIELNGVTLSAGDVATFGIIGENVILIAINDRQELPANIPAPRYNGNEVSAIVWEATGWTFNPGDSYFEHPEYMTTFPYNIYNYRYVSHEIVAPEGDGFNILRYNARDNYSPLNNFNAPISSNIAKVRFEMVADLEDVKSYIQTAFNQVFFKDSAIEYIANDWLRRYQIVEFYIGFTPTITSTKLYWSPYASPTQYFSTGLHPDLIPDDFFREDNGTFDRADDFPYLFDPISYTRSTTLGVFASYAPLTEIRKMLFTGYEKHLSEEYISLSLEYV